MATDQTCPICKRPLVKITRANFLWHEANCKRERELDQRAAELAQQSLADLPIDSKAINKLEAAVHHGWTIVAHLHENRVILYYRNLEFVGDNLRDVLKKIV
ncbi:hypothetical protein [Herpetosiphon geysericola]|uniref:Uncharacterized protein n=1 Tax=Herpetosiphon geysericola TaxID=70996 RepID=A0A0P6YJV9_9CHLR|nr:hypothetical protein [Herpetosiphon geysericola]KPL90017.1 hypothetical protein SE18_08680 [Herpetosiphon geysericola]